MNEDIQNIKNEIVAQIMEAESSEELEKIRINYLGRNGVITELIKQIKDLPDDKKKEAGILFNETKKNIERLLDEKTHETKATGGDNFDPTIPGKIYERGSLHIVTTAVEEISKVFERIGFVRARYPEVEWDWYSFTSLNFDEWHPARDEWETFLMDEKPSSKYGPMVLTPHTSSGQVREMQRVKTPPIRMINIAKCYRRQSDVSHVPMFHQFEGLVVDQGIAITHLKGTLDYFAKNFFGPDRKTRIRPYNFPFTEPSFEVDVSCDICDGKGCKLCKEGWLEIGGAGMVHPNVLKYGGIDPEKYSGFAFGWGVERVYMMKSGLSIPDIRLLYNTDLRFLKQF